jgi:hypothetical protein
VLNRFWVMQDLRQYIEAQIWDPVLLSDIEAFNIRRDVEKTFVDEVNKRTGAMAADILSKLVVFG